MNLSTEKKPTHGHREWTWGCQGGRGGRGMDWELGVHRCKILYLEWISNVILLYDTGKYIYSLVMEHDGGKHEKKNTYVCV